jgi:hypothetical protein
MKKFKQKSICLIVAIIFFPFQIIAQNNCEYEIGLIEFFSQQSQSYAEQINVLESDLIDAEYWRNHYETLYNSTLQELNEANLYMDSLESQLDNPITQDDLDNALATYQYNLDSMQAVLESSMDTVNIGPHFPEGWSMFGYSCQDSTDAIQAFSSISDKIEIVKDEWGLSYIPAWGFNAMGSLKFSEGYQIKMTEEVAEFYFCDAVYYSIIGCTDSVAENYNPDATSDDGSCDYIDGCTDPDAYNYYWMATSDDGSCVDAVLGCTSSSSSNYDPLANTNDNSCLGCTDLNAENYNWAADVDDGSCQFSGCTDINAANYDPNAVSDNGSCVSNCDETISLVVDRSYGYYVWFEGNISTILSSGDVIYSGNGTSYVISNFQNETYGTRVLFNIDVSGVFSDGEVCQTNITVCD